MDHNLGLTDEQDIEQYTKRDLTKHSSKTGDAPYKIIRDEVVGRQVTYYLLLQSV